MNRGSRRKFLASAAAVIGLPYLESLGWRRAHAQTATDAPLRFMATFTPNGFHMPDWTPTKAGTGWDMPYILAPLEPVRQKLVVLSGLDHHHTAEPTTPPGGHASGTAPFLTMRPLSGNYNDSQRTSIDQVIAEESPYVKSPLPSLQLGLHVDHLQGSTDGAPNDSYLESISWKKNVPQVNIQSPQAAFDRIFAGFSVDTTNADQQRRLALRASVLDSVAEQTKSLEMKLNAADRIKADEYFTSLRALETRIQSLGNGGGKCTKPAKPTVADSAPYSERLPVMLELAALAFQCDITRVMTFMIGRSTSHENFAFLTGSTSEHHDTSHHGGRKENLEKLKLIGRWQLEQFAKFLVRVNSMMEANNKSVLDNMCVYFSSEISDGNAHKKYDMPVFLAGDLGGKLKTGGNHFLYTPMTFPRPLLGPAGGPHTGKVLIAIANAFGVPLTTFGDGTAQGPLTDILAS